MSRFNAKNFLLFTLLTAIAVISVVSAQVYNDLHPINLVAIAFFVVAIIVVTLLGLLFTQKLFQSTSLSHESEAISAEELFSFTHDPATNLPTAQQALRAFESEMKSGTGQRYAAVVFKPINFQHVNSFLGCHNSDLLLLQLAYCLQQRIEDNTSLLNFSVSSQPIRIARLQSLQFLVFYNLTDNRFDDNSMLDDLCCQLANAVPEAMSFKSFSLNFELAFGIAISGENGDNFNEVVAHAGDALLKGIKVQQQVNYFDNNSILYNKKQLARMEVLRQDIRDDKLFCYLKPQVNINNHIIAGFQLRMHWYEGRSTKPLELFDFADIAEHSGELYFLTKYMLKTAFSTLVTLHKIGVYQRISVTLSSESLFEVDLVDYIEKQLQIHNIPGKYLMVELSEAVMLSASHRVKAIIDQLKSLDVSICIANFSGSYESLRYVRKMAIHQLQVDCKKLTNDSSNRVDKAITNALVTLTRSMKIPLVGTGIDRHEASQAFIAMGGELIQGNIIHPGVVPEEIEIWLEKWYLQHPKSVPAEARPAIY